MELKRRDQSLKSLAQDIGAASDDCLFVKTLKIRGLSEENIKDVILSMLTICNHCWNGPKSCQCWNDE